MVIGPIMAMVDIMPGTTTITAITIIRAAHIIVTMTIMTGITTKSITTRTRSIIATRITTTMIRAAGVLDGLMRSARPHRRLLTRYARKGLGEIAATATKITGVCVSVLSWPGYPSRSWLSYSERLLSSQ